MKKKVFNLLVLLSIILLGFVIISFLPEEPSSFSGGATDPTGFGHGYGSAMKKFLNKVVRIAFCVLLLITVALGFSVYKKKDK
ncbi:hypothetical protein [Maribacter sp.]|uniref:hypothetical protein n=1 Tax=Maribacter sp. TaxID=1897614 RepID=UPI003299BC09